MQKMNKKLKLASIMLMSLLMISVAYAVVKYTQTINNTVNVKGYEITLWRTDTSVAVTTIAWGDLDTGTAKTTEEIFSFTQKLVVKNTGDYDIFVAWKVDPSTPLPTGITLTAKTYKSMDLTWPAWDVNSYLATSVAKLGGLSVPIQFDLVVASNAPKGAGTFNILLLSATTSSG